MSSPYFQSWGYPHGWNDPGPPDNDDRPGFADATHTHRCVGCAGRVRCYADGCGLALHYQCGPCRAAGMGDALVTYGDLYGARRKEKL